MQATGRARVDPRRPRAFATCQRCGFWYNRVQLAWQYEWRGTGMENLRLLVCPTCMDEPQPQFQAFSPPPDPLPIRFPLPDQASLTTPLYSSPVLVPPGSLWANAATGTNVAAPDWWTLPTVPPGSGDPNWNTSPWWNDGGLVCLPANSTFLKTSATGLNPGDLYQVGSANQPAIVCVVPGLWQLPTLPERSPCWPLWNNGGVLSVVEGQEPALTLGGGAIGQFAIGQSGIG